MRSGIWVWISVLEGASASRSISEAASEADQVAAQGCTGTQREHDLDVKTRSPLDPSPGGAGGGGRRRWEEEERDVGGGLKKADGHLEEAPVKAAVSAGIMSSSRNEDVTVEMRRADVWWSKMRRSCSICTSYSVCMTPEGN